MLNNFIISKKEDPKFPSPIYWEQIIDSHLESKKKMLGYFTLRAQAITYILKERSNYWKCTIWIHTGTKNQLTISQENQNCQKN